MARYVNYEALDVYKKHYLKILGITQIPNLAYATTIIIASQVALQVTIAHHGTMPNNPNMVPTSINLSPQEFITSTTNNLSQPHFEGSVRSPLTLPKMGLESPPGFSKTQSSSAGVKTPCLEVFLIPLEIS